MKELEGARGEHGKLELVKRSYGSYEGSGGSWKELEGAIKGEPGVA